MSPLEDGVLVAGRRVSVSGGLLKVARLADEEYEDLEEPERFIAEMKRARIGADLFTFLQRLPDVEPHYPYYWEPETIAVLPVTTFDHWWKSQINNKTRNLVVKARKKGVVVRETTFDDTFVEGMAAIFNETPIRQERPFAHYGKDVATIRRQFSRYLFREQLLGAYIEDELIGFIMLADAGRFANLTQIISMVRHRDKSPNNALIAKAVELCAERGFRHLVYALWPRGHLREFKKHNAFEPVDLPRYFVPLTMKGELGLRCGVHRGVVELLPEPAILKLRQYRSRFYAYRHRQALDGGSRPASAGQEGA